MTDVYSLKLKADSREIKNASKDLDKLAKSSAGAEKSASKRKGGWRVGRGRGSGGGRGGGERGAS